MLMLARRARTMSKLSSLTNRFTVSTLIIMLQSTKTFEFPYLCAVVEHPWR